MWVPLSTLVIGGFLLAGGVMNLLSAANRDLFGGILALVLGGLCLLAGLVLLGKRTFMTLTPQGIVPRTGGLIPWHEVRGIRRNTIAIERRRTHLVEIELADRTYYNNSQPRGEKAPLTWQVISASFADTVVARAAICVANLQQTG